VPSRIAVFASGGGTNLQALLDRFNHDDDSPARVELVVGSRPGIGALERARSAGVHTMVWSPAEPTPLLGRLEADAIDLVVLAGWLRLVPPAVVHRYEGRMINIHPALLPAFGGTGMHGARVHEAVLATGARISGATVHLVDAEYDSGRILAQWPVPVLRDDTPAKLAARVLQAEHRLLPAVIAVLARGEDPATASWLPRDT
jgi:formyltetrahydrofolate-dependent phosphoribosylglycinamide formyltransferase